MSFYPGGELGSGGERVALTEQSGVLASASHLSPRGGITAG
ncbi:MAG: hypothetical protein RR373_02980 [Akkermansia sp.]